MQIDYVSTLIHKLLSNHVICIDIKESMVRPLIQHYEHECIWSKWVSSNERRVNLGGAVGCCAGGGVRRLLGWGREGIQCQQERPPLQCNQQFANIRGCHPPQFPASPESTQSPPSFHQHWKTTNTSKAFKFNIGGWSQIRLRNRGAPTRKKWRKTGGWHQPGTLRRRGPPTHPPLQCQ